MFLGIVVCTFRSENGVFQLVAGPGKLQIVKRGNSGLEVIFEADVSRPAEKHSRLFSCQWDEIVKMVCQLRRDAGLG